MRAMTTVHASGQRLIMLVAAAVVATLVATGSAGFAGAASTTPGDFSSYIVNNPTVAYVDGCRAEVGIVYDSVPYPNYRHVGGVRINCSTWHSAIDATVALYFYNGSRWVQYGNSTYGIRYSTYGSGTGIGGILRTPAYCVGSYRAYWWMVGVTVRTEHSGITFYSRTPSQDTQAGC
jgi:hypothetical protein